MIVSCPSCQKKFRLEEKHFRNSDRFRFACSQCGTSIEAVKDGTHSGGKAAPSTQSIKRVEGTWTESQVPESERLAMPSGKRVSLAILQGGDAGHIFPIEKPVFTIGRLEADATLNDSEVSRHHAQVELKGEVILLRDLKSTNGTYVNEQRITEVPIEHQSEFRVGSTTLMLIVTDAHQ